MERLKHVLRSALKNVWFNKKRYVYFVILLIFLQSLISCIFLFNHNNNQNEMRYLEKEFRYELDDGTEHPYHIVINNLTQEQYTAFLNCESDIMPNKRLVNREHLVTDKVSSKSGFSSRYYVYVFFESPSEPDASPYDLYERFCRYRDIRDLLEDEVVITETPLLLAYRSSFVNTSVSTVICLLVTAIGALTFGILFNTVINHFKFSYGVYMTYGANFKKLLSAALSEMLLLNLFTFIPSFLISILITFFLIARAGSGISIQLYPMFISLVCSVLLTVVSVTVVIKRISIYTPNKLLRSVNNESMIKSPRRSKRLPTGGFPLRSELLSMKRFRKYVISLLLTTMFFASLFCAGSYVMEAQAAKEDVKQPQFILNFPTKSIYDETSSSTTTTTVSPEETSEPAGIEDTPAESATGHTYTGEVKEKLYAVAGVEHIVKIRSWPATMERSHILIDSDRLSFSGRNNGVDADNGYTAFANVNYTLFDEEVASNLEYLGATITGDIGSVVNGKNIVAISDSINNTRMIKLKVGDTIKIARSSTQYRRLPSVMPTSANDMLETLLDCYRFKYVELTIGAIVSDLAVGESFPLYMNAETFENITGETPYFVNVEVYCQDGVGEDTVREMEREFRILGHSYDMSVTNTRQETIKGTNRLKNYPGLILYVSILLLLVSVLIMALSQSLFYQMRKQELDIYLCLGSDLKGIRKLFWVDAVFFSLLSAVFYSTFALIFGRIVYLICNNTIGGAEVRLDFYLPVWGFVIGLVVAVLSAFLSVMISYYFFKRNSAPVFTGKAVSAVDDEGREEKRNAIFDSDAR